MNCSDATTFQKVLSAHEITELRPLQIHTLQVNVGKYCNQTCRHCHVDAGPQRKEIMSAEVAAHVISVLKRYPQIQTLDITGGAPELHAPFRMLVHEARALHRQVIDRCNLTVLFVPGQEDLADFLAQNRVQVIASLPCYSEENVDQQRGSGVFQQSIAALKKLNEFGYGKIGSGLELNLIFNPLGPSIPPSQSILERDYKAQLFDRFGIIFNRLFTLTNMPIARFEHDLIRSGSLQKYMDLLLQKFNPAAIDGLMCRSMISVGWDGRLYDCDFNQMLDLPIGVKDCRHIADFDLHALQHRHIQTDKHCFGCSAGAGSSCSGALLDL
jgi:radical SAM/Cys-rich protein